jgi:multidrug efflux system outer membrane protein
MRRALVIMLCAAGTGCTLEPHYVRPQPAIRGTWPVGVAYPAPIGEPLPSLTYREVFVDPHLQAIIAEALVRNQNLAAAMANVEIARAQYSAQRSTLFPHINANVSESESHGRSSGIGTTPGTTGIGTTGIGATGTGTTTGTTGLGTTGVGTTSTGITGVGTTGTGTTGAGSTGVTSTGTTSTGIGSTGTTTTSSTGVTTGTAAVTTRSFQADIAVSSFDIDLFGRLRSLTHEAQDLYFATEAGARSARIILVGSVATAYLTLAADRSLLDIALATEVSAAKSVELTRAQVDVGTVPLQTLTLAQTLLDQTRSDVAALTTTVAQDRNSLELLVGSPVPDSELPGNIEGVGDLVREAPAGLDSRILLRRPDVAAAEYRLWAANAQIGAARAAFFPTISLTALAGVASTSLSSLFVGRNFAWQATGSASQPLFEGGLNVANLAIARGTWKLALADYQITIQSAFRDVANALARQGTIRAQMDAQRDLVSHSRVSVDLFAARTRVGVDPYLNLLIAQRTLYASQQTLVATQFVRAANLAFLYQSLGGDELIDAMHPPPPTTAKR